MSKLSEITVIFVSEKFRWDEVIVGLAESPDGDCMFSIKGPADPDELQPRQTYRFYGHWTEYKNKRTQQVERQFHFQTFVKAQPHGRSGIINYLKNAPHIGQRTAELLWEKFGGDAVRILRESPDVAVAAVNATYFTALRANEAAEHLKEEQAMEGCTIDLIDALHGRGFPKNTARAAVARWGNKAAEIIKRCPYYLMTFRGCGFLKTDAMYLDMGLPPGKIKRQALCAWHAVASDSSGDVWYPVQFVEDALRKKISGAAVTPVAALTLAKRGRLVDTKRDDQGRLWIAEHSAAVAEKRIAELISESEQEEHRWPELGSLPANSISEHQRNALGSILRNAIVILGGAPGTGKTFTAAALIQLLVKECGADFIAVAAPTGKAAVRVTENLQRYGLPLIARTIHSLLRIGKTTENNGDGWSFEHNSGNPLPYRFIIVDESSMIDNALMASLLEARAKGTHILFIGDINQLPPVGRGAPLRDMIDAGVPYAELTEIQRNSGRIVKVCHDIKNGLPIRPSRRIDLTAEDPENLYLVQAGNPEEQIRGMFDSIAAGQSDGLNPIWDCQVLTAVNAKSPLSRKALNTLLQNQLNATGEQASGNPFRVGDKIVNTKNGFLEIDGERNATSVSVTEDETEESPEFNDDGKVYVANGELAEVLAVEEKLTIARLTNPLRIVKIPRGVARSSEKEAAKNESSADSDDSGTGCTWDLGYALSVHKSQGSEWPLVLVMLDEYPGARLICSREWIFTADSRAKRLCLMIGKLSTANAMCRRQALGQRKTFLVEQIAEQRELQKAERHVQTIEQFDTQEPAELQEVIV